MRFERWRYTIPLRLRSLFRRPQVEEELDEEFQYHIQRQIEDNISRGMSPEAARYAALRAFGGVDQQKEECRDRRGLLFFDNLLQDARYAFRMARRSPALSAAVIISLALGVGANTSIFSAIDAILLSELPVREPSRLLSLQWTSSETPEPFVLHIEGGRRYTNGGGGETFSYPVYRDLRDSNHVFQSLFAVCGNSENVNVGLDTGGGSAVLHGVSGNFFQGLGVRPYMGRTLQPEDDEFSADPVAVISYGFWQQKLGRDPAILGRTIVVNGSALTIVGVTPPEFFGLQPGAVTDLWVPLRLYAWQRAQSNTTGSVQNYGTRATVPNLPLLRDPKTWWVRIIGRLKPDITEAQARSELSVLFSRSIKVAEISAPPNQTPKVDAVSFRQGGNTLRSTYSTPLLSLLGMSGIVLLIACANVASLLLARATVRQKEIAIRLSVGAGRMRLVRQLLTETVLLALMGGAAGLLVAAATNSFLLNLLSGGRPTSLRLTMSMPVLTFAGAISVLSGILFGLAPAIGSSKAGTFLAMRQNRGTSELLRRGWSAGKILVCGQVAFVLVLLVLAGLFVRTLIELRKTALGFDPTNLLLFTVRPGLNGYKGARLANYYEELQTRIGAVPGVRGVTFMQRGPIGGGTGTSSGSIPGYTRGDEEVRFFRHQIGPGYFDAFGIPLIAGRAIGPQDGRFAHHVVVVNQQLVQTYFHSENPIGHHIQFGGNGREYEIVGVVRDTKYNSLRDGTPPTVYLPYQQFFDISPYMTFAVRAATDAGALTASIRSVALVLDKEIPVLDVTTEFAEIDRTLVTERTFAQLCGAFGLLALLLACVGLYGTLAYAVARSTNEIGIRMALGATRQAVLWTVLKESTCVVLLGIAVGLPMTQGATRLIASQLFGVTPTDAVTIAGATTLMIAVGMLTGFMPAYRASKVEPLVALRHEGEL